MAVVWWTVTRGCSQRDIARLLPPAEPVTRARAARLRRVDDRASLVVAHALARCGVAWRCQERISDVVVRRRCPTCSGNDHGKPEAVLPDGRRVGVSISHTRSMAVVAVDDGAVGVDAEPEADQHIAWSDLTAALSTAERALLAADPDGAPAMRWWVRKEALTKLHGTGLLTPFAQVDVADAGDGGHVGGPAPGWIRDLDLFDHVAALATSRSCTPTVHQVTVSHLVNTTASDGPARGR